MPDPDSVFQSPTQAVVSVFEADATLFTRDDIAVVLDASAGGGAAQALSLYDAVMEIRALVVPWSRGAPLSVPVDGAVVYVLTRQSLREWIVRSDTQTRETVTGGYDGDGYRERLRDIRDADGFSGHFTMTAADHLCAHILSTTATLLGVEDGRDALRVALRGTDHSALLDHYFLRALARAETTAVIHAA